ncbi:GspH/FimT family pseudopilin [Oceanisphaera pacifica]|uniref:Type II secretion system protein H n=1 Tax=Oceanisphaera pacifica TaxID=2818389 RepID=A0ABS3NGI5_9GAMM|nr:GspH/FimT family pseudopilin [Oceanisphaera pacifica]MBO1519346.1 GspH/FimT family pseudopilin [Oceanisphaera pacifica]
MEIGQRGLTLIELSIGIAVVAILLSLAVPRFQRLAQKNSVRSAGMALYSDLQLARSEAIKRNQDITVCFSGSGTATWSYQIKVLAQPSDCSSNMLHLIRAMDHNDASSLNFSASYARDYLIFKPRRSSLVAGNITLTEQGQSITVKTWNNGIIRTCSSSKLSGVPKC